MNEISKKKPLFPISSQFREYLEAVGREVNLPVSYTDLGDWQMTIPVLDKTCKDTLWSTVIYENDRTKWLNEGLSQIYALLKTEGDVHVMEHLQVDRIDYCTFGNSNPYRVKIINRLNDNYDYFYVKTADASRVLGLELEHMLSPNRMSYLTDDSTLIEEHIAGIPGDVFMSGYLHRNETNKVRIAKEFVKFNERCFIRLLGDMRSYNYVVDITPDFDDFQYRIRAIDFDQQSYEGRKSLYFPQYFKENKPMVDFCTQLLTIESIEQYKKEERSSINRRMRAESERIYKLISAIENTEISSKEKTQSLLIELTDYYKMPFEFENVSMGNLVLYSLKCCYTF